MAFMVVAPTVFIRCMDSWRMKTQTRRDMMATVDGSPRCEL